MKVVNHHRPMRLLLFLLACLLAAGSAYAQREREIQPPSDSAQYSRRFFLQLRAVFGRFRDSDLERVFESAHPIECAELISENGEWRTVAFFNENRQLGDWYRSNFEEVKRDLSVFIFKGACRGQRGAVQLTTKFPVSETIEAFNRRQIALEEVEVNVNAPVRANFDAQTEAYSFDLPFLFLVGERDGGSIYSLVPPTLAERDRYAADVTDHWDCKSVAAENVTYHFLICRTSTRPRGAPLRNERVANAFGSSAYFILSDGREATSDVKLSFDDGGAKESIDDFTAPETAARGDVEWQAPSAEERLVSILREDFRVRFNPASWAGRMGRAQGLAAQRLSELAAFSPASTSDSCVWLPASSRSQGEPAGYAVTIKDREAGSATSVSIRMTTTADAHLGTLECFFPRSADAGSIAFSRWAAIVGPHLSLEVR